MNRESPLQIKLVVGGGIAILVVGLLYAAYHSFAQAKVALSVTQGSATVSIDGKTTTAINNLNLSPGTHKLTVQKTGYELYEASLTLPVHGQFSAAITLTPLPLKDQFVAGASAAGTTSLGTGDSANFTILDSQSFEGGNWIAAVVKNKTVETDPAVVVFHRIDGSLKLVLGPGTSFDSGDLSDIPESVGQYLQQQGYAN